MSTRSEPHPHRKGLYGRTRRWKDSAWLSQTDGRLGWLEVVQRPGAGWPSARAHACQARYHDTPALSVASRSANPDLPCLRVLRVELC
jgi:hypothetical protein